MNNSEKLNVIDSSIANQQKVKVYFNTATRPPVYGKFVYCNDSKDLRKKEMARFVIDSRIEEFEGTEYIWLSKIYCMDCIFYIKPVL